MSDLNNENEKNIKNGSKQSKLSEEKIKELQKNHILDDTPPEISDYRFIQEKIKDRPVDRKKLVKRMLQTAGAAVIFGLVACITFILLEPVLGKMINKTSPDQTNLTQIVLPDTDETPDELPDVVIDTDTEEKLTLVETPIEDMLVEEETEPSVSVDVVEVQVPVVQDYELELSDYRDLYRKQYALSKEVAKSLVTLTKVDAEADILSSGSLEKVSGLIIGDNGVDLLILTCDSYGKCSDTMVATFENTDVAEVKLWASDADTGIMIYSVSLSSLSDTTRDYITAATIGSSYEGVLLGMPVMAVGLPMGNINSICYGEVTSAAASMTATDASYQILTTNIEYTEEGSGFLVNTNGQVVGIITNWDGEYAQNDIVAYGFSGVKKLVENLSNRVVRVYAGMHVMNVTNEVSLYAGIPKGAYVTKVDDDSPSMNVGITAGDVIVQIGDKTISSVADYMNALAAATPDVPITVIYARKSGDEYRETEVEIVPGTVD